MSSDSGDFRDRATQQTAALNLNPCCHAASCGRRGGLTCTVCDGGRAHLLAFLDPLPELATAVLIRMAYGWFGTDGVRCHEDFRSVAPVAPAEWRTLFELADAIDFFSRQERYHPRPAMFD